MKSVIAKAPNELEIRDIEIPRPGPYQALVKTEIATLCNATDSKLLHGKFPGMETSFPMALGHESSGIVVETGEKVRSFKKGDRAIGGQIFDFTEKGLHSGWGSFSEYTLVTDHPAMLADGVANAENGWLECYEIHDRADVPAREAVLSCTWREILGAFKDFNFQPGKKILIFGSGPVGLSFVKFGKLFGLAQVDIVDRIPEKLKLAKKMGADNTYTTEEAASESFVKKHERHYDAVVDAVGLPSIVNAAMPLIKFAGDMCVYGVMIDNPTIDLGKAPLNFDLHIHRWPTRSEERAAMGAITRWVKEGKLSADDFITHTFKMEDAALAFEAVKSGKAVKVVLEF